MINTVIPAKFLFLDEQQNIISATDLFHNWITSLYAEYKFYEHLYRVNIKDVIFIPETCIASKGLITSMKIKNFTVIINIYIMGNLVYIETETIKTFDVGFLSYSIKSPLINTIELVSFISSAKVASKREEYLSVVKKNNFQLIKSVNDITDLMNYTVKGCYIKMEKVFVKNFILQIISTIPEGGKNVKIQDLSELEYAVVDKKLFGNLIYCLISHCIIYLVSGIIFIKYTNGNIKIQMLSSELSEKHKDVIVLGVVNTYDYNYGIDINIACLLARLLRILLVKDNDGYTIIF